MMDTEQLRDYCLSLGPDVEEKMPFGKFPGAAGVLAFYVCGHMFCYFDIESMSVVSVKCQPERINELRASHECITDPYNLSPSHWIGITVADCDTPLMQELVLNSYHIVKAKYTPKKRMPNERSTRRHS